MAKQIDSLTGIRGVAAIWVVLLHGSGYVNTSAVLPAFMENIVSKGWLGVDLFFILSGFVISYVHQSDFIGLNKRGLSRFLQLRIARIYPAHFIATIVLIPVALGAILFGIYPVNFSGDSQYSISKFFFSIFLINGWGFSDSIGWNIPSWSVGSEWFAYLCFPFVAVVYNKFKKPLIHLLLILAIICFMVYLAVQLNETEKYMLDPQFVLARVSSEFLIGCSLYNIYSGLKEHVFFDYLSIVVVIGILIICSIGLSSFYDFLIISGFAVLILSLSRSVGMAAQAFSSKILIYLGKISYSVYLAHATCLMVFNQIFKRITPAEIGVESYFFLFYFGFLTSSLMAGHLLYTFVEKPSRNYLRNRWID